MARGLGDGNAIEAHAVIVATGISVLSFELNFGFSSSTEPQFFARTPRDIDDNFSASMR